MPMANIIYRPIMAVSFCLAIVVAAQPAKATPSPATSAFDRPGAVIVISQDVETTENYGKGSTGSSSDRYRFIERVIASRPEGLELEYDLPKGDPDAPNYWQFPARILRPIDGKSRLLNQPELEARLAEWLTKAGLPRTACGQSVFTWNVFRIECDPQSALGIIAAVDLRGNQLRDGLAYTDPEASGSIVLKRVKSPGTRTVNFSGQAPIDAAQVRAAAA